MVNKLDLNDGSVIAIPIRNLLAIIFGVAVAVVGYFEVTNRIAVLERDMSLIQQEVSMNSEFRVKWPRGELGSLPDDLMQNADINMMKEQIELNTVFRNTWAPPKEVQESVRKNHEQEIRIDYLEKKLTDLENRG